MLKVFRYAMPIPAAKPYHVVPPSVVRNVRMSVPVVAVVVKVGAVALPHFTAAGHVAVRDPVPSWMRMRGKLPAVPEAGGFENVNVQFPVIVILNTLPAVRSTVYAVLLFAVTSVSP